MRHKGRWGAVGAGVLAYVAALFSGGPAYADTAPLSYGSRGAAVIGMQEALYRRGFLWERPSGVYDARTRYAVWAFQKSRGLQPRTRVGPRTLRALRTSDHRRPLPLSLRTGALVDLKRQLLTVYRDHRQIMTVHVSTGAGVEYCHSGRCAVAVTPTGDFQIDRRAAGWTTGPLGSMYNSLYFNGGIAIHGSRSVPRRPASHGCVRVPIHAADLIFRVLDIGDPVHVRASTR